MSTKSGIRWRREGDLQVVLPNGRAFDIDSREGANDFVDSVGTDFISTNLTAADDQELEWAYFLMMSVAENASPEKMASGIPQSELRTFIGHTRDTLDTLSTDRNWLRSSTLSRRHDALLRAVSLLEQSYVHQDLFFQ
jgi:hypothetical protein